MQIYVHFLHFYCLLFIYIHKSEHELNMKLVY